MTLLFTKLFTDHDPKGKTKTVCCNMLMHCDNLLYNFEWNIREPGSQNHPVEAKIDYKTSKTSERTKNQSQEFQSTSSKSNKEDINFIPNQLRFLEWVGREKKMNQTTEVIIQAII